MSLINPKYKQLKPTLDFLSDPAVLAQAWKKSHSYIRSHNWYADTLELDASTFNLEENINNWSEELKSQIYKPSPMRLVPAPKGDVWSFEQINGAGTWRPKPKKIANSDNEESISEPLRPLAHLSIKDQVIATAIMMCVADAVETAQGSTTDKENVSNYGNRLFCKWDDRKAKKKANFRWGNSTTYSKYFQDYQRFLERSAKSAHLIDELNLMFEGPNEVYEVHLDMSAFYDSIDRDELLTELRSLVDSFYKLSKDETESFWNVVKESFNWQWHENDFALNDCLKVKLKNDGLPQGLVASGFFANVYLIAFDKACKSLKGSQELDFSIHDYCRYVDDLRLIISVDKNRGLSEDEINKQLVDKLQKLLPKGIELNKNKTKIIKWNGEEGETVRQMEGIQSLASGPIDMDSMEYAESSLDNLFTRAESSQFTDDTSQHPLANVHQIKLEVREDTLLRFAANRWAKLFKSRRKLTNQKELTVLDAAQESVARRFVASWSRNPALTLLLKKGLQLFPNKDLLETVWDSLVKKLDDETPLREKNIAFYCLAEICRFSATDLKKVLPQDLPPSLNINDYFDWLEKAIRKLLDSQALPWYLKQQAGLVLMGKAPSPRIEGELLLNCALKIANGELVTGSGSEVLPAVVVSWQMTKSEKVITSLTSWLVSLERQFQYDALVSIAANDPDLFNKLFMIQNQEVIQTVKHVSTTLGLNIAPMVPDLTKWPINIQFASIIKSPANPFIHENALIKLAIASIKALEKNPHLNLTPQRILIECEDWLSIQNPDKATIKIFASENNTDFDIDPRYQLPSWINDNKDSHKLYELGCLLRACAVGSCDFTSQRTLFRQDINTYYGIKSSWFKRTISMIHSPEVLVGETAPMSGWVTELLFNLLQWPGLDLDAESWEYQWPDELSLNSLLKVLEDREHHQNDIFGVASNTPFYIERVKTGPDFNGSLRVINVQTLIPRRKSFADDLELKNPDFRKLHRNHLADVCNIILKKIKATDAAIKTELHDDKQQGHPEANLIIFPELSVHQDDIDLLEALSATTKAIIFAGIVFHEHEGKLINRALWLIPYVTPEKGIRWIKRWQGKYNMTKDEKGHITPWRPYQLIIELKGTLPDIGRGYRLSGSVCFDATDMKLTADLRDISDAYLISALNQDITTFDNMMDALHYHMYQHVVLVNTGEFGGSAAKAPFKLPHHRTIVHNHGNNQIAISIFEIEMKSLFEDKVPSKPEDYPRLRKTRPAGFKR
jgi:hypothetical protein